MANARASSGALLVFGNSIRPLNGMIVATPAIVGLTIGLSTSVFVGSD